MKVSGDSYKVLLFVIVQCCPPKLPATKHARGERAGGTIHPSPFYVKAELNQVSFCQSLCLCMVL